MPKTIISVTVEKSHAAFLAREAKRLKTSKSAIVDGLLRSYDREQLRRDIAAGFAAQTKEDVALAESDMGDYLALIDRA